MTLKVAYHRLAELELELTEAAQYYESESHGLGLAFLFAVVVLGSLWKHHATPALSLEAMQRLASHLSAWRITHSLKQPAR